MIPSACLRAIPTAASLVFAACSGAPPVSDASEIRPDAARQPCSDFDAPIEAGQVADSRLDEISGLVASRDQPGVLWVHNDSGGGPVLYALRTDGTLLGRFSIQNVTSADWEDLALEPSSAGQDHLWIGDIGDNPARDGRGTPRSSIAVYRVSEPEIDPRGAPADGALDVEAAVVLRYPDRPHDSEALAIDPLTGDLLLFAKEDSVDANLYRTPAPFGAREDRVLERVGSLAATPSITAMDIASDGRELLVRTYGAILWWRRDPAESWAAVLARVGTRLPPPTEPQGEAITFSSDGDAYLTISEGNMPSIWRATRTCP